MSRAARLRAPSEDGAVLAQPPLTEVGRLLAENRDRLARAAPGPFQVNWADLRRGARTEALDTARRYLEAAGEPVPAFDETAPLFAAGHQPELFHPGVWVKNFALAGLARAHDGAALNLVVDNDTLKSGSLRLPAVPRSAGEPTRTRLVDFDRWTSEVPYEERPVLDRALFDSFAERAGDVTAGWGFRPILRDFWRDVTTEAGRTRLLGETFARARRRWERAWGCHNLEVPLSAVCETPTFAVFFCHLLAELPRFRDCHNECLAEYRRRHGLRSRSHPVPDLAAEGDWLEAPFWAWRPDRPKRARLFARAAGGGVELRLAGELVPFLTIVPGRDGRDGSSLWARAKNAGVKVRTRALTTTIFARLFLSDLFIHGIGGGIYDELTDEVIARFYGLTPPAFLVLSATLKLPLPTHGVSRADVSRLAREVRDLHWNPQRHLSDGSAGDGEARALAAEKAALVARQPADGPGRRERFRRLREFTERLRPFVAVRERALEHELSRRAEELEGDAVATRRDYAFCLFPESKLRPFCARFV